MSEDTQQIEIPKPIDYIYTKSEITSDILSRVHSLRELKLILLANNAGSTSENADLRARELTDRLDKSLSFKFINLKNFPRTGGLRMKIWWLASQEKVEFSDAPTTREELGKDEIAMASSIDELVFYVDKSTGISSSSGMKSPEELKKHILALQKEPNSALIGFLTRTNGLREKVRSLLKDQKTETRQ